MTALKEYQTLESLGIWRESADAQRRDIVVSFGDNSLIIRDKSDTPLSHWSLPAIHRANPGKRPAIFRPAQEADEELEISDPDMIAAIEKVRRAIERYRPRSGRLRFAIIACVILALVAVTTTWLPPTLIKTTTAALPQETRRNIGAKLEGELARLTGQPCESRLGNSALARLKAMTVNRQVSRAVIVPDLGERDTLVLPGRVLLLDATLVEDHDNPHVVAGYMLKAITDHQGKDPVASLLEASGTKTTLGLLTTGTVQDAALASYAKQLITSPEPRLKTTPLLAQFQSAGLSATPFAYAMDVTGEETLALIEADPYKSGAQQLLSDAEWISLQSICGE